MKKSTILLLLVAVIAGAAVYYLEIKPGKPRDEEPGASKPAFGINSDDIAGVTVMRGGEKVELQLDNGKWMIRQPLSAGADQGAAAGLASDIANVRIEREFPSAGLDLKTYGLAEPAVKVEFRLKNGQSHRIELGAKEPISSTAYARIDGSQNIALLAASLLTSADKPVRDFRDRALLGENQYDFGSVKFTNANGTFELLRKDEKWLIRTPAESEAEDGDVSSLLGDITAAKAVDFADETGQDLAKYGLDKPGVVFTARLNAGGEKTITVGSKIDNQYYARVSDKPQVFKIDSSLYEKLNSKAISLKSKKIFTLNRDDIKTLQIKNPNLTLLVEKGADDKWLVREPAASKDKEAFAFKIIDPLETRAVEILAAPTAAISSKLAKPAVVVRATTKDGKTTVLRITTADGDNAYVQVEGKPEIYKVPKSMLDSMSFKLDEAVASN